MITIIDYGMGNIASVVNMFRKVGVETKVTSDPADLDTATKLVLPGVGAFDAGVSALRDKGLDIALREAADRGAYLLGVCLGMQLLFNRSDEGTLPGLGLISGQCVRFDATVSQHLRVPHMGWNIVRPVKSSALFSETNEELRFYFVHSFHAVCHDEHDIAAITHYGKDFPCALERDRVMGVQFHPEKSHRFGMDLFKRFAEI